MIGYGPEQENFALELTYNYGIDSYKNGDDLQYICLQLDVETAKAKAEAEGEGNAERDGGGRQRRQCVMPYEGWLGWRGGGGGGGTYAG